MMVDLMSSIIDGTIAMFGMISMVAIGLWTMSVHSTAASDAMEQTPRAATTEGFRQAA